MQPLPHYTVNILIHTYISESQKFCKQCKYIYKYVLFKYIYILKEKHIPANLIRPYIINFLFSIDVICYDDACHLKKYATNPKRCDLTQTSKRLKNMEIVVDKFHFKNHVDTWCKRNCNPYKCSKLDNVSNLYIVIIIIYSPSWLSPCCAIITLWHQYIIF